jgi:hypothetical protein
LADSLPAATSTRATPDKEADDNEEGDSTCVSAAIGGAVDFNVYASSPIPRGV